MALRLRDTVSARRSTGAGAAGAAGAGDGSVVDESGSLSARFPWRRGELIGTGQSGRVFKALRMDSGKLMAVKVTGTV